MNVLTDLQRCEKQFHWPAVEAAREKLATMLHPDFTEIGASGTVYTREEALETLIERAQQQDPPRWHTQDWHCRAIAPGTHLLHYTLCQGTRITKHTTLWQRDVQRGTQDWQALFHQGTPA